MEGTAFIVRAYDMAAYALYKAAEERGNPFFSLSEFRHTLAVSPCSYNFPRNSKPEGIVLSLEKRGLVSFVFLDVEIVGIEVKACPFVPPDALEDGEEQEEWFSGERKKQLRDDFLKRFS